MVYRWIFPAHGGGWARRYMQFRLDMWKIGMTASDVYPCPPVTLFDFRRHDDAVDAMRVHEKDKDAWRTSDDRVIGGFSISKAEFSQKESDAETVKEERSVNSDSEVENMEESILDATPPFLRWSGTLDTTIGLQSSAQRSGFAALRSPEFPLSGANLQGLYDALEITCRTDGRSYHVNLKVASAIPHDIYQGIIPSSGRMDDFEQFVLPFDDFGLTGGGRERELSRVLDDAISIESIGFVLMDDVNDDFEFDLARIRAVNLYRGKVFESKDSIRNKK